MTALLSLDRVSKRFRGLHAVDGVSFAVPEGAIFAVIGPNGAGKTTLFNLIAGAIAPDPAGSALTGERFTGLRAGRGVPARHRPHVPARAPVPGAERRGQRYGRRAPAPQRRRCGARSRRRRCCGASICSTAATNRRHP